MRAGRSVRGAAVRLSRGNRCAENGRLIRSLRRYIVRYIFSDNHDISESLACLAHLYSDSRPATALAGVVAGVGMGSAIGAAVVAAPTDAHIGRAAPLGCSSRVTSST